MIRIFSPLEASWKPKERCKINGSGVRVADGICRDRSHRSRHNAYLSGKIIALGWKKFLAVLHLKFPASLSSLFRVHMDWFDADTEP